MASPSYTYTLTNGTTADADQVMQNFNDILNGVTDGSKDLSISALTCAGTTTLNGAINLGNATTDDITVTGRIASDVDPKTAASYTLGDSTQTWRALYLDNSATDGGAVYFNASSTAFVKSDASAGDLDVDGFTNLDINAANLKGTGDIAPETTAAEDIGTTSLTYRALYLDNGATDGGAIYFNAGTTANLKSSADGATLDVNGFTTVSVDALASTGVVHASAAGVLSSSTIVNADVSSSAAIAGSKISPSFGAQNLSAAQATGTANSITLQSGSNACSMGIQDFSSGRMWIASSNDGGGANNLISIGFGTITTGVPNTIAMQISQAKVITVDTTSWSTTSGDAVHVSSSAGSTVLRKVSSSRRFKKDIEDLQFDTALIYDLKPRQFRWKENNQLDFGLVAEEVDETLPQFANYQLDAEGQIARNADGSKIVNSVKYFQLLAPILAELKKLRDRVIALES
jgi:hypothetical protein